MTTAAAIRMTPYVGPRPFRTGEALYGRDREVLELLDLLIAERIVLLYSPSGAGKTSLVQAALAPALEHEGFVVRPAMRVSLEPPAGLPELQINRYVLSSLLSLEEALPGTQQKPIAELAVTSFQQYLDLSHASGSESDLEGPSQGASQVNEVLIFDQFEEILTVDPTDQAAKEVFFAQVGAALRNRGRWALFSMREDYVAGLDPYLRPIPTRFSNTYRLDLLGEQAARQAVQQPAQKVGIDFTDAAARKLVDNLRRVQVQRPDGSMEEQLGQYVEPVQLQVVCSNLWERLPDNASQVVEADVAEIGDVDTALADYYAERVAAAASQTGSQERDIREWFQDRLITEQGIRGQVLQGPDRSEGLNNDAIWALVDAHVVRAEKRRGATWFELAHDRLIAPVRANNARWFEANLSAVQREAALWDKQNRPNGLLLRGEALTEGERWASEHTAELTPTESDFLEASRDARKQTERMRRLRFRAWMAMGVASLAIVALVLTGIWAIPKIRDARNARTEAIAAWHIAEEKAREAVEAEKKSGIISENAQKARAQAILVTAEAQKKEDEAEKRLRVATALRLAAQAGEATSMDHHPEEGLLLALESTKAATQPGDPQIAAPEEGLRNALAHSGGQVFRGQEGQVGDIAISPDRHWLATTPKGEDCKTGPGHLWELTSDKPEPKLLEGACETIKITPDGHWVITGSTDSTARLWDLRTQPVRGPLKLDPGGVPIPVNGITISASGGQLFTKNPNGLSVWDLTVSNPATGDNILLQGEELTALSPDGHWLATAKLDPKCKGSEMHLWNLSDPSSKPMLLPDQVNYLGATFSRDSSFLVTAGRCSGAEAAENDFESIRVWNLRGATPTPIELSERDDRTNPILHVALSSDGTWVLADAEGEAYLWNRNTPQRHAIKLPHSEATTMFPFVFSNSGNWLFAAGRNQLWSWNLSAKNPATSLRSLLESSGSSGCLDVRTIQDRWLYLVCGAAMTVLDLTEDDPASTRRILVGHESAVTSVDIQTATRVAVTRAENGIVRLWDLTTGSPIATPVTYSGANALSADRRFLAAGSEDGIVYLLDLSAKDPIPHPVELRGRVAPITQITFSPDGHWLIAIKTSATDKIDTTELWNLASGAVGPMWSLGDKPSPTPHVQFSGDSRWLAIQQGDAGWLWKSIDPRPTPLGNVGGLVFSPDDKWLVAASVKASPARLWKLTSNGAIASDFNPEAGNPAFSANGRWLFTRDSAGARLWDLSAEKPTSSVIPIPSDNAGNTFGESSPDSRWFLIRNSASAVLVDLRVANPVVSAIPLPGLNGTGTITFSPNGRWLFTRNPPHARLWDLAATNPATPRLMPGLPGKSTTSATFSRNSRWLFVTSNSAGAGAQLWDLAPPKPATSAIQLFSKAELLVQATRGGHAAAAFSPDSRWLFTSNRAGASLLDLGVTKPATSAIALRNASPSTAAFSPNNRWLVTFSQTAALLWKISATGGPPVSTPVVLPRPFRSLGTQAEIDFSADARWIIRRGTEGISLWSTRLKEDLIPLACRTAGRNLTKDEWDQYFQGESYHKTCPEFPPGEGVPQEANLSPKHSVKKSGR